MSEKITGTYSVILEAHLALYTSIMARNSLSGWETVSMTVYLNTAREINVAPDSQALYWVFTLIKTARGAECEQTLWWYLTILSLGVWEWASSRK